MSDGMTEMYYKENKKQKENVKQAKRYKINKRNLIESNIGRQVIKIFELLIEEKNL